jgi:hypothetical protein
MKKIKGPISKRALREITNIVAKYNDPKLVNLANEIIEVVVDDLVQDFPAGPFFSYEKTEYEPR